MNESHINLTFSWWILDVSRFWLVKSQYPSTNPMKSQQYPSIFAGETPAFFPSPRDSSMLLEQMGLMETVLRSSIHKDTLSGFVTWLKRFAGWWYTYPSEKKVSWDDEIPNIWEKCSKPPTSLWLMIHRIHPIPTRFNPIHATVESRFGWYFWNERKNWFDCFLGCHFLVKLKHWSRNNAGKHIIFL